MCTHFGKLVYIVHVVEFQYRGLSYAHIVLKVLPELPFTFIDATVIARIPNDPELADVRSKVLKYNMHSKDHLKKSSNRCNKKEKCVFSFPFDLATTTSLDNNGWVIYRRDTEDDKYVVF